MLRNVLIFIFLMPVLFSFFSFLLSIYWICIMIMITLCKNDTVTGMETRYLRLPIEPAQIVRSRFLFMFQTVLFSWLYSIGLSLLLLKLAEIIGLSFINDMYTINDFFAHNGIFQLISWNVFILLVAIGVYLFIFYRFGYQWGKYTLILYFVLFISSPIILAIMSNTFQQIVAAYIAQFNEYPIVLLMLSVIIYFLLMSASILGYKKRRLKYG